jgi:hypothetical protein
LLTSAHFYSKITLHHAIFKKKSTAEYFQLYMKEIPQKRTNKFFTFPEKRPIFARQKRVSTKQKQEIDINEKHRL